MKRRRCHLVLALLLTAVLAAGCGRGEHRPGASQVAAKVNSYEITVSQVNSMLSRGAGAGTDGAAAAKHAALGRLINLQLARQKALEEKLDRSPEVVLAIENASMEILARAYLEKIAAAHAAPSVEEVHRYYLDHPELFAQRQIYNIEEIAVSTNAGISSGLRAMAKSASSMAEIANWLRGHGVHFSENRAVRTAEQIPLNLLPRLLAMKDGAVDVLDAEDGRLDVVRVLARKSAPVDEATATPRIRQFLANRRSSELIAEEMKRLRKLAKIEYLGEFAGGPAAADDGGAATVRAGKAGQPVEPNIAKGVRGLQ